MGPTQITFQTQDKQKQLAVAFAMAAVATFTTKLISPICPQHHGRFSCVCTLYACK
jgi:hypothetical protein